MTETTNEDSKTLALAQAQAAAPEEQAEEKDPTLAKAEEIALQFGLEISPEGEEYGGPGKIHMLTDPDGGRARMLLRPDMGEAEILDAIASASQRLQEFDEAADELEHPDYRQQEVGLDEYGDGGIIEPPAAPPPLGQRKRKPGEITYYLLIDDTSERNTALAFLQQQGVPRRDESHRKVQELRIDRLDERHTVIPVLRNVNQDLSYLEQSQETGRVNYHAEHGKVAAFGVIDCAQFVSSEVSAIDGFGDRVFDEDAFCRALGKICVPATLKRSTERHTVRIRYA